MRTPKSESRNPSAAQVLLMPAEHAKPRNLRERTLEFGTRILQITGSLPRTMEARSVRRQLIRSGTSIGAHLEEADGAFSNADTRRGFIISKKEAEQLIRILRTIIDRLGT